MLRYVDVCQVLLALEGTSSRPATVAPGGELGGREQGSQVLKLPLKERLCLKRAHV